MTALSKQDVNASLLDLRTRKALLDMIEVATVAAAGSSATDAASLTGSTNVVTASDGTKGVILPRGKRDTTVRVINSVAGSALLVYPDTGGQINALTATTGAFTVPGSNEATFVCDADLHWYVAGGGAESFDNLSMANPINYDHNTTITAFATGGQASATALTGEFNNVTTCATAGDSVKLPTAALGLKITVKNSGATSLAVFPFSGDSINALAVNLSVNIPVGGEMTFRAISATVWETNEVFTSPAPTTQKGEFVFKASDNAADHEVILTNASHGQATTTTIPDPAGATGTVVLEEITNVFDLPQRYDANTTITAFATGGQASATALTGEFNNVTVCATAGDSVKLPAAAQGLKVTVKNSGAASLAVFPASSDSINALAADLSVNIPVGGELTFRAISATVWETNEALVLSAPTTQSGELVIKAADNAADYEIAVVNASHGQATTHTIPDPGAAAASFVLTEGAQTINGAKTFGGEADFAGNTTGAPGAGFTDGVGAIHKAGVMKVGTIVKTSILLDLTGTSSSTTDLDVIGTGASVAHIGQITAAKNGTILTGRMTCLEAPAGGVTDIDVYSATESTGVFDSAIGDLTETALLTSGGAWSAGTFKSFSAWPAANDYLYLTGGAGGTAAAYTAGKFLIELEGYDA